MQGSPSLLELHVFYEAITAILDHNNLENNYQSFFICDNGNWPLNAENSRSPKKIVFPFTADECNV